MTVVFGILAVLFALYGIAVFLVGSGTWFFAFWFVLALMCAGAAWGAHAGWCHSLPFAAKAGGGILLCALLAGFLATQTLIAKDFGDEGPDDLDYLVVLGAQVRDDGLSLVLQHRLDTAVEYLERNPRTLCIVSGGQGYNEPLPEAHVMAAYLETCGIDRSRIIQEDRSLNTTQNIALSSVFLNPETDSVGIVTNNFHVFRSVGIARKAGFRHVYGIAAPSVPLYLPNNLTRESLSIAKDYLAGNL